MEKNKSSKIDRALDRTRGLHNVNIFYMPFFMGFAARQDAYFLYMHYRTFCNDKYNYDESYLDIKEKYFPTHTTFDLKYYDRFLVDIGLIVFRDEKRHKRSINMNPANMTEKAFKQVLKNLQERLPNDERFRKEYTTTCANTGKTVEEQITFLWNTYTFNAIKKQYGYEDLWDLTILTRIRRMFTNADKVTKKDYFKAMGLENKDALEYIESTGGEEKWKNLLKRVRYKEDKNQGLINCDKNKQDKAEFLQEAGLYKTAVIDRGQSWTRAKIYGFFLYCCKKYFDYVPEKSSSMFNHDVNLWATYEHIHCDKVYRKFIKEDSSRHDEIHYNSPYTTAKNLASYIDYTIMRLSDSGQYPKINILSDPKSIKVFTKYIKKIHEQ